MTLPALRARLDDIPLLAAHLVAKHAERMGRTAPAFSAETVEALCAYTWPGNVRELENAVQRALALTSGDVLEPSAFPERVRGARARGRHMPAGLDGDAWADGMPLAEARKVVVERFERTRILHLLTETAGNISQAAKQAQLDRSNFRRLMARHGISAADIPSVG